MSPKDLPNIPVPKPKLPDPVKTEAKKESEGGLPNNGEKISVAIGHRPPGGTIRTIVGKWPTAGTENKG